MSEIVEIPIGKIKVGEHEQRLDQEDEGIAELADSIRRLGLLVPLVVVAGEDAYTLVAGHRRLKAARHAGLSVVPCCVKDISPAIQSEVSFAENFFRKDLSPVELACAINDKIEKGSMTFEELAAGFHRSVHWVMRMKAVADWPNDILEAIHNEGMSVSAASNLALVSDSSYRAFLVRNAVEQGATARTTASWLQAWRAMQPQEEAITSEPVAGVAPSTPMIPQAPCICCSQIFAVNEMSHVPVCGACVQIIRQVGLSVGGQQEIPRQQP